jgi:SAM-dependent methyltransferase
MSVAVTLRDTCRICDGRALAALIHVDRMPLAGQYLASENSDDETFLPLTLNACEECGLVQLAEVIDPAHYAGYHFFGSLSMAYRSRLDAIADMLIGRWQIRDSAVVEIGCNDGYLLRRLRDSAGNRVFGYEPAVAMKPEWKRHGIAVADTFFGVDTIDRCPIAPADLVIARHVVEHVDDLHGFLDGLTRVMAADGLALIEVPDIDSILDGNQFSNIYHEHLSYFSAGTLTQATERHELNLVDQSVVPVHGGSLLMIFRRHGKIRSHADVDGKRVIERGQAFAEAQKSYFRSVGDFIARERRSGLTLAGYGAAHRTVVTCAMAGLTEEDVGFLVDQNPLLHGLVIPGARIPIVPTERLLTDSPDGTVIFATSFEDEIVAKNAPYTGQDGRFISILPEPRYLS